jgi:hypothetical protein
MWRAVGDNGSRPVSEATSWLVVQEETALGRNAMAACGPSRRFAATLDEARSRTEADINRQTRPAASIANDLACVKTHRLF